MGVKLRGLFPSHPLPPGWYSGKTIAIDAHNVAFRYLTSIRGPDGGPLQHNGRAIGHLLGFLSLVRHLRMQGAEPLFIWDGDVHPRKAATVRQRIERRQEAQAAADEALARGDAAAYARLARGTVYVDQDMIDDASLLLGALGVAVVRADHDAERYAAALCRGGHADAVATEDYDALVAGAPTVVRKAGGQGTFLLHLEDLGQHGLTPEQLRHVAILCGTDWHPGIRGFGPKTAMAAVSRYPDLQVLFEEAAAAPQRSRLHTLVANGNLQWEEFAALAAFVADLPTPPAPPAPAPDPAAAADAADALGLGRARVMAAFC